MSMPLRLLLVEDSEDDAALVLRELKKGDYEVTHRRVDSPEAMDEAVADGDWDIVICDYSMPRFSGMDALRVQHARNPDTPFIFLSGTIGEEAAIGALKEGAHDCLLKSDLKRLIPTVRRELRDADERRARKRLEQEVRDLQKFAALAKLGGGIAQDLNNALGELLATISASVYEVAPHDCAILVLHDQGGAGPRILIVEQGVPRPMLPAEINDFQDTWLSHSTKQPSILDLGAVEQLVDTPVRYLFDAHMLSACLVPLIEGEQPIGALAFASLRRDAFGRREMQTLTEVANQIATAVGNTLAFRQIAELRDQFRRKSNISKKS